MDRQMVGKQTIHLQLEDLDFADDLAIQSLEHSNLQGGTNR